MRRLGLTVGLVASVAVLAIGCMPQKVHLTVAKSPVPPKPVFTVIPASLNSAELLRASQLQTCLLNYGARVVERPPIKSVEKREATGRTRATQDIVATFPDAEADILVVSYAGSNRLKILNNKSRGYQLVLSETYPKDNVGVACGLVWYALFGLGLVDESSGPKSGETL